MGFRPRIARGAVEVDFGGRDEVGEVRSEERRMRKTCIKGACLGRFKTEVGPALRIGWYRVSGRAREGDLGSIRTNPTRILMGRKILSLA